MFNSDLLAVQICKKYAEISFLKVKKEFSYPQTGRLLTFNFLRFANLFFFFDFCPTFFTFKFRGGCILKFFLFAGNFTHFQVSCSLCTKTTFTG